MRGRGRGVVRGGGGGARGGSRGRGGGKSSGRGRGGPAAGTDDLHKKRARGDGDDDDDAFNAFDDDDEDACDARRSRHAGAALGASGPGAAGAKDAVGEEGTDDEEEEEETADEKRLRIAKAYLERMRAQAAEEEGDRGEVDDVDDADPDVDDPDDGQDFAGLRGRDAKGAAHAKLAAKLRAETLLARGLASRRLASRLILPPYGVVLSWPVVATAGPGPRPAPAPVGPLPSAAALSLIPHPMRGHRLSVTSVALSSDEAVCWSVSKAGRLLGHDVVTGAHRVMDQPPVPDAETLRRAGHPVGGPPPMRSLLTVAASDDGRVVAAAGGDRLLHVWDVRTGTHVRSFPGHRGTVLCAAFRAGSQQLFTGGADRLVKVWSLSDMAYVDTLFGHQAEVLAVDAGRRERALSAGADRTCRVWKLAEEAQLVFRGHGAPIDAACYLSATEWLTGGQDGALALWSQVKKKPGWILPAAHGPVSAAVLGAGGAGYEADSGAAAGWVSAVAACRGSDLAASGAADGAIRLWAVTDAAKAGGQRTLKPLGALPARGFVNALAWGRSGAVLAAGMGQEPRLGRWAHDRAAHNGVLIHRLELGAE